ncbi:uncharacterized protein LOC143304623 [Bombus vancouverensis nearcticus]|uniref:uncharacterized protein LOC143304623 n=1 Tax=Bombus vancouverensis nearcticus TaxID=2705178 RepID=UPI00402BDB7D
MARQPIRIPPRPLDRGRGEEGEDHGRGQGLSRRGGSSGITRRHQRLQLDPLGQDRGSPVTLRGPGVPGRDHPSVPDRQIHRLRREERGGKKTDRARRFAGVGVGTDTLDHGLRLRPPMSDAPGSRHGVLRRRHPGPGRGTVVARHGESHGGRRGVRGARHSKARPDGVAGQIRGTVVLRPATKRNTSSRTVGQHWRRRGPGETPDEVPGSHDRQQMDLRTALRATGPEGDSRSQRPVRPPTEHRRSRIENPPTLRGSGSVPSPLRGTRLGQKLDGQSPQPDLAAETAEDDRYPHSERLQDDVIRVGDRAGGIPPVRAASPGARTRVRTPEGPDAIDRQPAGPEHPGGGEEGDVGTMALAADPGGRRAAAPGRSRRASQLGGLEGSRRSAADLQDDAGAHRPRSVRRVPAKDSARGDIRLSPLQGRGGHVATHAGVLSGMGGTTTRPTARNRRELSPRSGRRGHAQRAPGVRRHPHLLRAGHAGEGAGGKKPGASSRSVQDIAAPEEHNAPRGRDAATGAAAATTGARKNQEEASGDGVPRMTQQERGARGRGPPQRSKKSRTPPFDKKRRDSRPGVTASNSGEIPGASRLRRQDRPPWRF